LIVTPETAIPIFPQQLPPGYLDNLQHFATASGSTLAVGMPLLDGPDKYANSLVAISPRPQPYRYDKAHLVPFGEFIPPGFRWFTDMLNIPLNDATRGGMVQAPFAVKDQLVLPNICYEDVFGEEIARRAADATLLVNMSNVAWFGDSLAPAQHLQIARLRAIETGRMHLTATNTGITAAIDRDGRVLGRLPQFAEARLEVAAQGYEGMTPYLRLYDWPIVLFSLFWLALCTIRARFIR